MKLLLCFRFTVEKSTSSPLYSVLKERDFLAYSTMNLVFTAFSQFNPQNKT